MKKGVVAALGAAGVVVVGWVGMTWYTGTKIEARVERLLEQANQHLATDVPFVKMRLAQRDYTRGLFSSQVRYVLTLEESDSLPPDFPTGSIEFDTRIEHGPFPLAALARGVFAPRLAASHTELVKTNNVARLFELTHDVPPYADDILIHYSGQVESQARIAAIQYKNEETGWSLAFSGLEVQSQADDLYPQMTIKGQGKAETLSISTDSGVYVSFADITLAIDNAMGKFGILNGDVSVNIARLEVGKDDGVSLTTVADNLGYRVAIKENAEMLSVEATYGLDKLVLSKQAGDAAANDIDLGGGEVVVKLDNLNGTALQELQQIYMSALSALVAQDQEVLKHEIAPRLVASGDKLISGKPVLRIAPRWHTDAGESKLAFSIGLRAPYRAALLGSSGLPDELVFQFIEHINVDVTLSKAQAEDLLAKILVEQRGITPGEARAEASQQVRAMAGMAEMFNMARNDGDKLIGAFRYADGVAQLNGMDVPLQEYLPDLFGMLDTEIFGDADDDDDDDYDDDDDDYDDDDDDYDEDDHDHDDDDDHDHDDE